MSAGTRKENVVWLTDLPAASLIETPVAGDTRQ
jgi:hypothetical protein